MVESETESRSVVSNSLRPHGLYSPWDYLGHNTGVGSLSLLQGTFPAQGSNPGLLHCRRITSWFTREAQLSFIIFFKFKHFFWRIVDLQCHVSSRCTKSEKEEISFLFKSTPTSLSLFRHQLRDSLHSRKGTSFHFTDEGNKVWGRW